MIKIDIEEYTNVDTHARDLLALCVWILYVRNLLRIHTFEVRVTFSLMLSRYGWRS